MSDERQVSRHMKRIDVTLIFKKGNDNEKKNYRPASMLSVFPKDYYHKALHLGCCSSPRSASVIICKINFQNILLFLQNPQHINCSLVYETTEAHQRR